MESGKGSRGKEEIADYSKNVECENKFREKVKCVKPSMIPIMKNNKVDNKLFYCKKRPTSSKPLGTSRADKQQEDFECKLKVLREKEKIIKEYYLKIEEMIQKLITQKGENNLKSNFRNPQDSSAKKMTSDPSVVSKSRIKSEMSDFENNIQQISKIWLKTTSDLTSSLKNLKNNSSPNPIELQMENNRIQLAIKQARSLTLLKTRDVIAEAKRLFRNREIIRSELENLLNPDSLKNKLEYSQTSEGKMIFERQNTEEQGMDESGDSLKEIEVDSLENIKANENEWLTSSNVIHKTFSEIKIISDKMSEKQIKQDSADTSAKIISEVENLKKELTKKNKTITNLNKKLFDLQKTCNEKSTKCNQLQVKLFEFHEKFQWNEVLWKQIGKLKERIKVLQQTNSELEIQKKKMECKILRREQEINRLLKLNHILRQRKQFLDSSDISVTECKSEESRLVETIIEKYHKSTGNKAYVDEKIIVQKQHAVNQLKKILAVMKDQENFAQKQISMFQTKIEELEKNRKP